MIHFGPVPTLLGSIRGLRSPSSSSSLHLVVLLEREGGGERLGVALWDSQFRFILAHLISSHLANLAISSSALQSYDHVVAIFQNVHRVVQVIRAVSRHEPSCQLGRIPICKHPSSFLSFEAEVERVPCRLKGMEIPGYGYG